MEYTRLGRTGLEVSRITVGSMSWGDPERGGHPWVKDEAFAEETIRAALEAGINFFDTANVYSGGSSEEFTGRALWKHARREEVVLATKVNGRMRPAPTAPGVAARDPPRDRRLARAPGHRPRRPLPDPPVGPGGPDRGDDGGAARRRAVGKARYIGASSMYAWQFAKAQEVARSHGWTEFVSMQDHYNLIYREEEREMLPLCEDQGVGVIPWSPLARGRLTRPWDTATTRTETDEFGGSLYRDEDAAIVQTVLDVAGERGVAPAQVALAWLLAQPVVTSPIVGITKPEHLTDAVAAVDLELTQDELDRLSAGYVPHAIAGHQ